jgi:hypothetical protein
MRTNIPWAGQQYHSLENCVVSQTTKGIEVNSIIIGSSDNDIFRIEYFLKITTSWKTHFLEINSRRTDKMKSLRLQDDGKGNWRMNGKPAAQFSKCIDIDISITPFTNTLPINRLNFAEKKQQMIDVIYLDVLEWKTKRVKQNYTKLSKDTFKYENVPNDFEASIKVDKKGFVTDYPGLFSRSAIWEADARSNK